MQFAPCKHHNGKLQQCFNSYHAKPLFASQSCPCSLKVQCFALEILLSCSCTRAELNSCHSPLSASQTRPLVLHTLHFRPAPASVISKDPYFPSSVGSRDPYFPSHSPLAVAFHWQQSFEGPPPSFVRVSCLN